MMWFTLYIPCSNYDVVHAAFYWFYNMMWFILYPWLYTMVWFTLYPWLYTMMWFALYIPVSKL